MDAGIAHRETASKYLKMLVDIGVLEELKVGREKLFVHPKFLRLLTTDSNEFHHYPAWTKAGHARPPSIYTAAGKGQYGRQGFP